MRAGVAQGEFISHVAFSLCIKDKSTPGRIELAIYFEVVAIIVTCHKPESFDSELADVENLLVRQLLALTERWPKSPEAQTRGD